jgi:hypothetical protein
LFVFTPVQIHGGAFLYSLSGMTSRVVYLTVVMGACFLLTQCFFLQKLYSNDREEFLDSLRYCFEEEKVAYHVTIEPQKVCSDD